LNIDPQPQNGGCLWLLVPLLFFFSIFGIRSDAPIEQEPLPAIRPTPTPGSIAEPVFTSPHVIESVRVVIRESMPPQVALEVSGYVPDGCTFPTLIEQQRSGATITVDVYRLVPLAVMCPAVIVPYAQTIELGTFEPGSYTVDVNGISVSFTID